jgi:hypothetical protein
MSSSPPAGQLHAALVAAQPGTWPGSPATTRRPASTNGIPQPDDCMPRPARPLARATGASPASGHRHGVRIAPRVGLVHGVQPTAKIAPSRGAPSQAGRRAPVGAHLALAAECRPPTPRKTSASTMTSAPPMRVSRLCAHASAAPAADTASAPTNEDDAEPEPRTGQRPSHHAADARRAGRARATSDSAGDIAEETRHERQHARRREGHQPGQPPRRAPPAEARRR